MGVDGWLSLIGALAEWAGRELVGLDRGVSEGAGFGGGAVEDTAGSEFCIFGLGPHPGRQAVYPAGGGVAPPLWRFPSGGAAYPDQAQVGIEVGRGRVPGLDQGLFGPAWLYAG